jgi:hypothetical protein
MDVIASGLIGGTVRRVGLPGGLHADGAVVRADTANRGGRGGLGLCSGQSGKAQRFAALIVAALGAEAGGLAGHSIGAR